MRPAEKGFLLLTGQLGDPACRPITVAQLRTLMTRMEAAHKRQEDRELEKADLLSLGFGNQTAEHILFLLSRQEQLAYYLSQGKKNGCYPITRISDGYPQILRRKMGQDCPGCLWAKGDMGILKMPAVALVGSRELHRDNLAFAREAGRQAARQGVVLVSGNARGADQAAQESCLEYGGAVISVVADKLADRKENPQILYLSENGFDAEFSAFRALSRNHIIHALGERTLVAQCTKEKGGTWNGAVHNLRYGLSPLYCFQDGSDGVSALCQMGAIPIDIYDLQSFSALPEGEPSLFD